MRRKKCCRCANHGEMTLFSLSAAKLCASIRGIINDFSILFVWKTCGAILPAAEHKAYAHQRSAVQQTRNMCRSSSMHGNYEIMLWVRALCRLCVGLAYEWQYLAIMWLVHWFAPNWNEQKTTRATSDLSVGRRSIFCQSLELSSRSPLTMSTKIMVTIIDECDFFSAQITNAKHRNVNG